MSVLIGNSVSFVATAFLLLSAIARSRRGIYFFQFLECIFLIISQLVFRQVAGAVSMSFSAIRNHLASKDKYTLPYLLIIFSANAVFGIILNTGGIVGFIPVVATLFLTVASYFVEKPNSVRASVMINLAMWVAYSFIIRDYVSGVSNSIALAVNAYTLVAALCGVEGFLTKKTE